MYYFGQLSEEQAKTNSPVWAEVVEMAARFVQITAVKILPNARITMDAGAEAAAVLFCMIRAAEKDKDTAHLMRRWINTHPGRNFGARLLRWIEHEAHIQVEPDVQVIWESMRTQMAHAYEMTDLKYKPIGPFTPEQVTDWIKRHGGLGGLSAQFKDLRRQTAQEKAATEAARIAKQVQTEKREAAEAAGFGSDVDAWQQAEMERKEAETEATLQGRFGEVKGALVERGTVTTNPPDGRLLIAHDGKLYLLSEQDERQLLRCAASEL